MASKPIFVLGGTGKTGRRVVSRLLQRGLPAVQQVLGRESRDYVKRTAATGAWDARPRSRADLAPAMVQAGELR